MELLLNWRAWLALGLAAALAFGGFTVYRAGKGAGSAEKQAKWDKAELASSRADVEAAMVNAKETQRRLDRQKANQDAHDKELAAARGDASLNAAAADRLREQNAVTAKRWRDALSNPTTGGQCAAAGDAIGVLADVLGRADQRAGILASYADTARAAGLKCERDYDSLIGGRVMQAPVLGNY